MIKIKESSLYNQIIELLKNQYVVTLFLVTIAIMFDIITGFLQAKINGTISSFIGHKGIWKKISEFSAFFFGVFLDISQIHLIGLASLEMNYQIPFKLPFGLFFGIYIIVCECISICENLYKADIKLPNFIINTLKIAKDKLDTASEQDKDKK